MGRLADEMMARDMVARVKAVEIALHVIQLLGLVSFQRLGCFIFRTLPALGYESPGIIRGGGQFNKNNLSLDRFGEKSVISSVQFHLLYARLWQKQKRWAT